jgi:hypothetical protein
MPNYLLAYHVGRAPATPEEGAAQMAKWNAWVGGLGKAMVDPGTPLGKSVMVSADGVLPDGGPSPLMGFSVVAADGLEAALSIARSCPYLAFGTIEVAEMKKMPGSGN